MAIIRGSAGPDSVTGTSAADYITPGAGADTMVGLGGDDRYAVTDAGDTIVEQAGGGRDRAEFDLARAQVEAYTLPDNVEDLRLIADDFTFFTAFGNALGNLFTGSYYYELFAGAGDDRVTITFVDDFDNASYYGEDGGDRFELAAGGRASGGEGNDSFAGVGVFDGGAGDDLATGGDLDGRGVEVDFGDGQDVLTGGDGFDVARGDEGNDTLNGGGSADDLDGGNGDDLVDGGDGSDFLSGGNGTDRLFGRVGEDILFGLTGRDTLDGGDGDDFLQGGDQSDLIVGGRGSDILYGGQQFVENDTAADRFAFKGAWGTDRIEDFKDGRDRVDLRGSGITQDDIVRTAIDADGDGAADDTRLSVARAGFGTVDIVGVAVAQFTLSDILFG